MTWLNKKNSRPRQGGNRCQQANPMTSINVTTIKKDKNVVKNFIQVKYYSCHKKGNYTNKFLDK